MLKTIQNGYGKDIFKVVRRFVKTVNCIYRQKEHLWFNHRCKSELLIPRSLWVKPIVKKASGYRLARKQSRERLLLLIGDNHSNIQRLKQESVQMKTHLMQVLSSEDMKEVIDFAEAEAAECAALLRKKHEEKLCKLRKKSRCDDTMDVDNSVWIKNLSSKELSTSEKRLLQKGLNFAVAPSMVKNEEVLAAVEAGITKLSDAEETQVRCAAVSVLKAPRCMERNLSKEEREAFRRLKDDVSIVIMRADKGNCTVVMDTSSYNEK